MCAAYFHPDRLYRIDSTVTTEVCVLVDFTRRPKDKLRLRMPVFRYCDDHLIVCSSSACILVQGISKK